ncbi:MAG TPA: MFS transporter [Streptosporangiaceae bacterium]|nr:MFS transporter [Streptosporangiaceae bacterium]
MAWAPEEAQITSRDCRISRDGEERSQAAAEPRSTFGEVFRIGEFRALWMAQVLSVAGDQLARVAITLLVFEQTRSALLAAIAFAASVVPTFAGGLILSGLADRWPRRQVMIGCDLSRAVLVGLMALPAMPIGVRVGLLFLVTMIGAPFTSARAALYPDILSGDRYVLGTAVTLTTLQFAQVVGFAAGGAVVGVFGVRTSLLADAATFIFSAVITRLWVLARPAARAAAPGAGPSPALGHPLSGGLRLVFATPALLTPMLLGWLSAFYNVPEGVAAPLAHSLGGGAVATGLILAAGAFGASLGAVLFSRLVRPRRRLRWMSPLAIGSCAMLVLFAARPTLPWALLVLVGSGLCDCYQLAANAAFVRAVPPGQRSQAFGIAQAGMSLGQGAAMVLAGAAAGRFAPSLVIATAGVLGIAAGTAIALSRVRAG